MKFLIIAILIFCTDNFVSNGWNLSNFQTDIQNQLLTADTTVPYKTTHDAIEKINFKGIIILDNKKINYDNQFLYKPLEKGLIKDVTILKYLPMDSVLKYGDRANFGMLIMRTR